jgi:hypothetical protein
MRSCSRDVVASQLILIGRTGRMQSPLGSAESTERRKSFRDLDVRNTDASQVGVQDDGATVAAHPRGEAIGP